MLGSLVCALALHRWVEYKGADARAFYGDELDEDVADPWLVVRECARGCGAAQQLHISWGSDCWWVGMRTRRR